MFPKLIERVIDILYEYQSHHSFEKLENIKVVLKELVKKINIKILSSKWYSQIFEGLQILLSKCKISTLYFLN
jgi:S-adenosylmethionine/arginine decarboxylase-like enzyme